MQEIPASTEAIHNKRRFIMKRAILVLMVLTLALCLASAALAASTANPPKTVCFALTNQGGILNMINKNMGTIKTSTGPVKFYAIHGEWVVSPAFSVPITGTGHVTGTTYHFNLTGTERGPTELFTYVIEGKFDLALPRTYGAVVGTNAARTIRDITISESTGELLWDDSTNVVIPY
jgi:hypothetical protein